MKVFKGVMGTLGELLRFFWQRRLWWIIPMVIVLLVFAFVIMLGGAAGVGPFIYTLF